MSDTLYLSLWYPNLRIESLPDKLTAVLGAFAAHGGERLVYAATVWPVSWSEPPVFQRVWGQRVWGRAGAGADRGVEPRQAVEEATELFHDDYVYEFQIGWSLWELEAGPEGVVPARSATADPSTPLRSAQDDSSVGRDDRGGLGPSTPLHPAQDDKAVGRDDSVMGRAVDRDDGLMGRLDPRWVREPRLVRVTGYGPLFDEAAYEQDGHVRIDFGSDTPFLEEDAELDAAGARHVEENVRQLVELTAAVEEASGATARLLWSELGESLAQRLAARLGVQN
ncbi:MAG: hypothetical protein ACRD3N_19225 [Terracidiphilus sp.]